MPRWLAVKCGMVAAKLANMPHGVNQHAQICAPNRKQLKWLPAPLWLRGCRASGRAIGSGDRLEHLFQTGVF